MGLFSRKKNKKSDVLILFATTAGNAKLVARKADKYLKSQGLTPKRLNVTECELSDLIACKYLLLITSTDGEGDLPMSADKFYEELKRSKEGLLANIQYSICGLGDSSYQMFCEGGKLIERQLKRLGASAFIPRTDCDIDFADQAINWIKACGEKLANGKNSAAKIELETPGTSVYAATVTEKENLTEQCTEDLCYRLKLSLTDDSLKFNPGDSIELIPDNPKWLVNEVLKQLAIQPETTINGHDLSIAEHLEYHAELCKVSELTIRKYGELSNNLALKQLLSDRDELKQLLKKANFLDIIIDKPFKLSADQLVEILPTSGYRQYSVASSPLKDNRSIEILVKTVRYQHNNRLHEGAASVFLNDHVEVGEKLKIRHYPNSEFRLPADTHVPLIFIATGTGIAPFRAFLQEIEYEERKHPVWLIYGEKYKQTHYYFNHEWEAYQKEKVLTHLSTAFSRDSERKVYVSDVLLNEKERLKQWVNDGAHIYICGSKRMGKGVEAAINNALPTSEEASVSVSELLTEGRFHVDTY